MIHLVITALCLCSLPPVASSATEPIPHSDRASDLARPEKPPTLDSDALAKKMGGSWNKKGNAATEYKSSDSNYRTYKPTVSTTKNGGLLVSFKVDHIRGGAHDDHAQIEMEFDAKGQLISSSATMSIAGRQSLDSKKIVAAAAPAGVSAPAAWVASEVANALLSVVQKDHGGRKNFPSVVNHNINWVVECVSAK